MNGRKDQDADGFTLVTRKHRGKNNVTRNVPTCSPLHVNHETEAFQKDKIEALRETVEHSEFFMSFKEMLDHALQQLGEFKLDIVCYGLGRFATCYMARYQLAFLVALRDALCPDDAAVYDPVFSMVERDVLQSLGLRVLPFNEGAKRRVLRSTLFFMPHCDIALYDNLLSANWSYEGLTRTLILGNGFSNYELQCLGYVLKRDAPYVHAARAVATEVTVNNCFEHIEVFNDLGLHYFKPCDAAKIQDWDAVIPRLWPEPKYRIGEGWDS